MLTTSMQKCVAGYACWGRLQWGATKFGREGAEAVECLKLSTLTYSYDVNSLASMATCYTG